jgi:hypothetical protein
MFGLGTVDILFAQLPAGPTRLVEGLCSLVHDHL